MTRSIKFQKNSKKIQKTKKIPLWLPFKPIQVGKCREREKIKLIGPFRPFLTRNRKFQKNRKKIKKIPLWLYFKPKQVGKYREGENIKSIVPFRSNPTRNRKFQKNSKKILKIKKIRYVFFSSQNSFEKVEKEIK